MRRSKIVTSRYVKPEKGIGKMICFFYCHFFENQRALAHIHTCMRERSFCEKHTLIGSSLKNIPSMNGSSLDKYTLNGSPRYKIIHLMGVIG